MEYRKSEKGMIPVLAIVAIVIASALIGAGLFAWFSGKAKFFIVIFFIGVILGLIVLPNLKKIIRWYKDVKKRT